MFLLYYFYSFAFLIRRLSLPRSTNHTPCSCVSGLHSPLQRGLVSACDVTGPFRLLFLLFASCSRPSPTGLQGLPCHILSVQHLRGCCQATSSVPGTLVLAMGLMTADCHMRRWEGKCLLTGLMGTNFLFSKNSCFLETPGLSKITHILKRAKNGSIELNRVL